MQTFLPFSNFFDSAQCLDRSRLGKQRVEAKQIINAINQGPKVLYDCNIKKCIYGPIPAILLPHTKLRVTPWYSHTCTQIWLRHKHALAQYAATVCKVWRSRGYEDSLLPWFEQIIDSEPDTGIQLS